MTALTAIDTKTGLMMHCPIPKKGAEKYSEQELCKFLMETGRGNAQLHSDNEPALISLIKRVIAKMGTGLSLRSGPTYSPQSQGDIERAHGTLLSQLRTVTDDVCKRYNLERLDINHPLFHWCVLHCNFLLNRFLIKSDGQTAFSRRWEKEYCSPLCQFGETVMYRVSQPRANTDIKWGKGIWLGRSTVNNEIIVGTLSGEVITVRTIRRLPQEEQQDKTLIDKLKGTTWSPKRTAEFEGTLPPQALEHFRFGAGGATTLKEDKTDPQPQQPTTSSSSSQKRPTDDQGPQESALRRRLTTKTSTIHIPPPPGLEMEVDNTGGTTTTTSHEDTNMETEGNTDEGNGHKKQRILSINNVGVMKKVKMTKKDKKGTEESEILLNEELEELAWNQDIPLDPEATLKGMLKEAESITDFNVYDKVPLSTVKGPVLSSRWVMKPKGIEVKARVVVRGFEQAFTDVETASPTPSLTTMLTLLSLGVSTGMHINTGDVSTAFLHAPLTEEVLVQPPKELVGTKYCPEGHCWRLKKALYGLRSAPLSWNKHITEILTEKMGFRQSTTDACLFINDEKKIYLLLYVDDLLTLTKDDTDKDWLFNSLGSHVLLKHTGKLEPTTTLKFLGRQLTHRGDNILITSPPQYITDLLTMYNLDKCRATTTTGNSTMKPTTEDEEPLDKEEHSKYVAKDVHVKLSIAD